MGGKSAEHEISLKSGREVAKNLNPKKYNVLPIIVSKDGISWQIGEASQNLLGSATLKLKINRVFLRTKYQKSKIKELLTSDHSTIISRAKVKGISSLIKSNKVNVVFIAMHGLNGEDGTVQGFLDLTGVPYTGSGVLASALGMDKIYSRTLFAQSGLTVPSNVVVEKGEKQTKVWTKLKPPVFVKPRFQGSSVGTSMVKSKKDLKKALKLAYFYDNWAIVEEYLEGTEVTCAVLGNKKPQILPLVEISPKKEYFDYEAKYDPNLTDEIVPARISPALTQKAQKSARVAYEALGCRGFGRVDMIIRGGKVYVLEVNTIPGLTPVSLFPKAAAAAGISYPQLLDKIINFALNP